jgi:hypothetical protein
VENSVKSAEDIARDLFDLRTRMVHAEHLLTQLANERASDGRRNFDFNALYDTYRLVGKREGVGLAISYLDELLRSWTPPRENAWDAAKIEMMQIEFGSYIDQIREESA